MHSGLGAIVTGSTSGIGLALAQALARSGTNVMLNGFGERDAIEVLRRDLAAETGVQVAYSGADMSQPAEIAQMVRDAEARFGRIDVLVNNAGIQFEVRPLRSPGSRCPSKAAGPRVEARMDALRPRMPGQADPGKVVSATDAVGLICDTVADEVRRNLQGVQGARRA